MARVIRLDQIGDLFDDQIKDLVKRTTYVWQSELVNAEPENYGTPKDTGHLAKNWFVNFDNPYKGRVFNTVIYAEPVAYGTNLPPSWKGRWRTKRKAVKGFPSKLAEKVIAVIYVPAFMRDIVGGR